MRLCLVVFALAGMLDAQALGDPFFLLRITRGEPASIEPYRAVGANVDVLGMHAITGPSETWLLEPHGSFAGIEALDRALATAAAPAATRMVGVFRTGLSYRPDEALKLTRTARYFQVTIFRMRPGADMDFSEMMRMRKAAFDSINLDRPELGYQIISGSTSGTYVFLAPLPSLRTLDNTFARMPAHGDGGGGLRAKDSRQIAWDADISREHMLFRVQPNLSHVSEAFAAADPEFWRSR